MPSHLPSLRTPLRDLRADLDGPSRWPALDGVRGAALLAVIGYHLYRFLTYGTGGPDGMASPVWAWPLGLGKFSIDVFFVLSGLLIALSWRSLRKRHGVGGSLKEFWARRGRRVLPAWWLSLLVFVPLASGLSPFDLAALVTLQQYLVPGLTAQVNVVSWSLTTEIHFYLLVPLVIWAIDRIGGRWVLGATLLLSFAWWHGWIVDAPTSLIVGRLDQFVAGALAGAAVVAHDRGEHRRIVDLAHHRAVPWVAGVVMLGLGIQEGALIGRPHLLNPVTELSHPICGLIVALLFVRRLTAPAGRSFEGPVLRGLGLVSYSAYLWHYPILLGLLKATGMLRVDLARLPAALVVTAIGLAAVTVVTIASYLLVERPFIGGRVREPADRRPQEERKRSEERSATATGADATAPADETRSLQPTG